MYGNENLFLYAYKTADIVPRNECLNEDIMYLDMVKSTIYVGEKFMYILFVVIECIVCYIQ